MLPSSHVPGGLSVVRRNTSRGRSILSIEALEDRKLLSSGIGAFVPSSAKWSLRSTASAGPAGAGALYFGADVPGVGGWEGAGRGDNRPLNPPAPTRSLRYGTPPRAPHPGGL